MIKLKGYPFFRFKFPTALLVENLARTSPLYDYWQSNQDDEDESKRLLKINPLEPASNLFKNEPYKWENLYQSILREVIKGDESSMKGLMVLLSTINNNEKEKTLIALDNILDKILINRLRIENYRDLQSDKNLFRFLAILFSIFTNPYGLVIKREKNHIYEKTGMIFYEIRNFF